MNVNEFAAEWLGGYDWRYGFYNPETEDVSQQFTLHRHPEYYTQQIESGREECYLTVNPMKTLNTVDHLERVVWDFDSKSGPRAALKNAQTLRKSIMEKWGAESLLVFTGGRGYHVYAWFTEPYKHPEPRNMDTVYKTVFLEGVRGLGLETFDDGLTYGKHLIRLPFTVHQGTKQLCMPVEVDPVTEESPEPRMMEPGFVNYYRSHGIPSYVVTYAEQPHRESTSSSNELEVSKTRGRMRPCLKAIMLTGPLNDDGWLRTMAVFELRNLGVTRGEVASVLEGMENYDKVKTEKHLAWVYGCEKVYSPKCSTIAGRGYCFGEACNLYRWLRARGQAPDTSSEWGNRWAIAVSGGASS